MKKLFIPFILIASTHSLQASQAQKTLEQSEIKKLNAIMSEVCATEDFKSKVAASHRKLSNELRHDAIDSAKDAIIKLYQERYGTIKDTADAEEVDAYVYNAVGKRYGEFITLLQRASPAAALRSRL